MTEKIYQKIFYNGDSKKPVSIHLSAWPKPSGELIDAELEKQMEIVKVIIESANSLRQEQKVKLKWPVSEITIETENEDVEKSVGNLQEILCEMGNTKKFSVGKVSKNFGEFEKGKLSLGNVLEDEAVVREFSRHVQILRKEKGLNVKEKIKLWIKADEKTEKIFKKLSEELKYNVGADDIVIGKVEGSAKSEADFDGNKIQFGFEKL